MSDKTNKPVLDSQEAFVRQVQKGDRQAYDMLIDRYYQPIYKFLRRTGHDRHISEDLTQQTFIKCFDCIGSLRKAQALSSWLYKIAANISRQWWRKNKKTAAVYLADFLDETEAKKTPDSLEQLEQLELLNTAVQKLSWHLRQTIVLHYFQQLTIKETAEAINVSQATIKGRINRSLKKLRKIVGKN